MILKEQRNSILNLGFKANDSRGSQDQELTSFSFGENDFVVNFFLKDILPA